jgi:hypothetical protein
MRIDIQTFRTKTTRVTDYHRDAYEFRADLPKRWHWLQRAAIAVLKKLGAHQRYGREEVQRIRIDTDDIIEAAHEQIDELLRANLRPGVILMGYGQFDNMRACARDYLRFSADMRVVTGGQIELLGIPAHTIPHMDGILVLPERPHQVINAVMGRGR